MNNNQYNEAYIKAKRDAAKRGAKKAGQASKDRLPPGQTLTDKFPVLDLGIRPSLDRYPKWRLKIWGEVGNTVELGLEEVKELADDKITVDFSLCNPLVPV